MFKMEVRLGNAAFDEAPMSELARILRIVADALEAGTLGAPVHDFNGNQVGRFDVTGERS